MDAASCAVTCFPMPILPRSCSFSRSSSLPPPYTAFMPPLPNGICSTSPFSSASRTSGRCCLMRAIPTTNSFETVCSTPLNLSFTVCRSASLFRSLWHWPSKPAAGEINSSRHSITFPASCPLPPSPSPGVTCSMPSMAWSPNFWVQPPTGLPRPTPGLWWSSSPSGGVPAATWSSTRALWPPFRRTTMRRPLWTEPVPWTSSSTSPFRG